LQPTFPSVLYFQPKKPSIAGSMAIDRYLASETKGRFIQSLKAYLADRTFEGTAIGTQHYTLEKLIALIGKHMSEQFGFSSRPSPRRIVLGRPVHFSNPPDAELDAFATERLLAAIRLAGFDEIVFEARSTLARVQSRPTGGIPCAHVCSARSSRCSRRRRSHSSRLPRIRRRRPSCSLDRRT